MPDFKALADVDFIEAAGRLHPLLLHLPIGILVGLCAIEIASMIRRAPDEISSAKTILVWLLAITAPLAAVTGWLLHESGHFGPMVERHEWFGVGTMSCALLAALAYWKKPIAFRPLVLLAGLVLLPTAHIGATLVHGEDFLLEPWLDEPKPDPAETFTSIVQPIFDDVCTRCHGERKQKAELRLDSLAGLNAGTEYGSAYVPAKGAESRIIEVMRLPKNEDEHMPPENKRQPTDLQIQAIEAWINSLDPQTTN